MDQVPRGFFCVLRSVVLYGVSPAMVASSGFILSCCNSSVLSDACVLQNMSVASLIILEEMLFCHLVNDLRGKFVRQCNTS